MQHHELVGEFDPGVGLQDFIVEERVGDRDAAEHAEGGRQVLVELREKAARGFVAEFRHSDHFFVIAVAGKYREA